jgi:hypothetical protein
MRRLGVGRLRCKCIGRGTCVTARGTSGTSQRGRSASLDLNAGESIGRCDRYSTFYTRTNYSISRKRTADTGSENASLGIGKGCVLGSFDKSS